MTYERFLEPALLVSLSDTPVLLLNGARQVGKTTLLRHLAARGWGAGKPRYVTLDDPLERAQAESDPASFLGGVAPLMIDEVQLVPDLLPAIKQQVDNDRRPGRYLLTGSADIFTLPTVSESLAGRMAIRTLHPLAQAEIAGDHISLVDLLFAEEPLIYDRKDEERPDRFERIATGGYPEAVARARPARREEWFEDYVTTILTRDVRDLASIERLTDMPRLLRLMAARTATLANYSEYSRALGIPNTSLKRYLALLKATFLVNELPAWSANLSKRLVRSPKIFLNDTGLAAALTGFDPDSEHSPLRGPLFETWVINELRKHAGWAGLRTSLYHYRTHGGEEIDLIVEDRKGRLVAIEIKSRTTLQTRDFTGLEKLRDALPDRFHRGVVLYAGEEVREYSEKTVGLPVGWITGG